ncbi:phosphatidylcholine:ceramide cholinephosphotransferase [Pimephales promelas]|nr:phosphatidylcholine:ceramide cholinephosphotransferase [Pimephales promelas]
MASEDHQEIKDPADASRTDGAPSPGTSCPVHSHNAEEAKRNGLRKGLVRHRDYVKISVPEGKVNRLPSEWWKTFIALFYAILNLVLTTVMITVVHERVPPKENSPPLPDKFFDYIDRVQWAFTVTEVNGMVLVSVWSIQLLFHRYKAIVGRRYFFLLGTLYMYRCITMYVTTLPVPGMHMVCAPKVNADLKRYLSCSSLSRSPQDLIPGYY